MDTAGTGFYHAGWSSIWSLLKYSVGFGRPEIRSGRKPVRRRVLCAVAKESERVVIVVNHVPMKHAVPAHAEVLVAAGAAVWASLRGTTACILAVDASASYRAANGFPSPINRPIPYGCSTALVRRRHRPGRELAGGCAFRHAVPEVEPPPACVPFQDGVPSNAMTSSEERTSAGSDRSRLPQPRGSKGGGSNTHRCPRADSQQEGFSHVLPVVVAVTCMVRRLVPHELHRRVARIRCVILRRRLAHVHPNVPVVHFVILS